MENQGLRQKVQVWIVQWRQAADAEVLLLHTHPGRGSFWQPVTGSVDPGESFEHAAARELREETGLTLAVAPLGYEFEFENRYGRAREKVFFAEIHSKESAIQIDPKEHDEWKWVSASTAFTLLQFESNAEALRRLLKKLQIPH